MTPTCLENMTRTSPLLSWSMAPAPAGPGFPLPHCWVDIEFQCALWKRDQPQNFPISCMVIMQRRYPIVQNTYYSLDYQTLFFEETHFAILKITKWKMSSTSIETLLKNLSFFSFQIDQRIEKGLSFQRTALHPSSAKAVRDPGKHQRTPHLWRKLQMAWPKSHLRKDIVPLSFLCWWKFSYAEDRAACWVA